MKISVELSHVCPLGEIPEHAIAIESKGFFRAWVPDTLVSQWDAWLAADRVACHTTHLNIGLGVTNPYTRHPMTMAQMAATLQAWSGGRLSLSIGKGIPRLLEKAGTVTHPLAVIECIAILRSLIAGDRTVFQGEHFHIDGIRLRTLPPEKSIPIYLAAMGEDSWQAAREMADGVATIWSGETAETKRRIFGEKNLPVAALVPFSVSDAPFFPGKIDSRDTLIQIVSEMVREGLDEVIIAYRNLQDLNIAEEVVGKFSS